MSETRMQIMAAIAHQRTVMTQYNGAAIKLAPHLLFERHGDLFVSALNMSKAWRTPEEQRLGQFKLAGLSEAQMLEETFAPLPGYEATLPREGDKLVLAL
ncbi:hypothetical protein WBP06_27795 [Novosphingobium sp. BL-8H]|uniref:hypothetical protein n=1 Tax=Novosphingobium sp. BL-8H TaxID=3127640 RepID=UPI0037578E2D